MPSLLPALGASYERVAVVVALLAVLLTADLMGRFGRSRFNVAGKVRCVLLPAGALAAASSCARYVLRQGLSPDSDSMS